MKIKIKEFFSIKDVFKTRNLVIMAMMAALSAILTLIEPYINPQQKLFAFDYLPRAIVAIYMGPWAAIVTAFVADFLGVMLNPSYGYFFGYAISAMLTDFMCALFLYKRNLEKLHVAVLRVSLWRILVMVIVVFGLNGIWTMMMYGTSAENYFQFFRLARNFVQFPIDVFLVVFLGRYLKKFFNGK